MARIILGILLFCVLAYTIGYFVTLFQKPLKEDGRPKTTFEVGAKVLVVMIGIALLIFALFVVYTFIVYIFENK